MQVKKARDLGLGVKVGWGLRLRTKRIRQGRALLLVVYGSRVWGVEGFRA